MSQAENTGTGLEDGFAGLFARVLGELGISVELDLSQHGTLLEMIESSLLKYGDRPAFSSLGYTLSFRELDRLSARFASWLQHHTQLEPGDRVAVQTPNLIQYPVVVIGALRAGMVVVNTNPLYSERELRHQFTDAGVKALVVQANVAATAAAVLPDTGVQHVVVTELADLHPPPETGVDQFGSQVREENGARI